MKNLGRLDDSPALPELEPIFATAAWIERHSTVAIRQFCRHGLSDNTCVTALDVVEGRKATVKIYHYQCLDHGRPGLFRLLEPKLFGKERA